MVRRVSIVLTLLVVATLACGSYLPHRRQAFQVVGGDTTLISQGFEGTGYDNGESWTTLGDGNPDRTDNAYAGTHCLVSDASNAGALSPNFAASSSVTVQWTSYITGLGSGTSSVRRDMVQLCTAGGASVLASLGMHTSTTGLLYGSHGSNVTDTDIIATTSTRYFFKLVYTAGSGANGTLDVYVNTTGFTFGSPNVTISTGTSTGSVESVRISGNSGSGQVIMFTDSMTVTTP